MTELEHPPSSFALRLRDHSMEPAFRDGDIVVINPTLQPQPGDFVAATDLEGHAWFREYREGGRNERGESGFELWPVNPRYAEMRSDRQPLAIVGVMVEHRSFYRRPPR